MTDQGKESPSSPSKQSFLSPRKTVLPSAAQLDEGLPATPQRHSLLLPTTVLVPVSSSKSMSQAGSSVSDHSPRKLLAGPTPQISPSGRNIASSLPLPATAKKRLSLGANRTEFTIQDKEKETFTSDPTKQPSRPQQTIPTYVPCM